VRSRLIYIMKPGGSTADNAGGTLQHVGIEGDAVRENNVRKRNGLKVHPAVIYLTDFGLGKATGVKYHVHDIEVAFALDGGKISFVEFKEARDASQERAK
jgi:hypothetical protein